MVFADAWRQSIDIYTGDCERGRARLAPLHHQLLEAAAADGADAQLGRAAGRVLHARVAAHVRPSAALAQVHLPRGGQQ